jgi:hypothetical protein
MLLALLLACPGPTSTADTDDTGFTAACEAYPPPRFTIHVVDGDGAPLRADRAWAVTPDGTEYDADCVTDACTDWTGIADDGPVELHAEAGGVEGAPVDDEIVRDDAHSTLEEAEGTVMIAPPSE